MSVRLEMLQVARLAPTLLGESTDLVRNFLLGGQNRDGAFADRAGQSDLYYTVFGIEGLLALQTPLPVAMLSVYLDTFEAGAGLDFIHLCCLARCRAALAPGNPAAARTEWNAAMLRSLETFRSADGGYNPRPGATFGTAYGNFMALAACQDLGAVPTQPERIGGSLQACATPDGAWANEPGLKAGATNATAAAITLLRQLSQAAPAGAATWLRQQYHPHGGFRAQPAAPLPDLLSTATTLHALAGLEHDVHDLRETCLDFVDTLWSNEGGFHGHWEDDSIDCEYTYYGLLALGHLSLA